MQEIQGFHKLETKLLYCRFWELAFCIYEFEKISTRAVLENEPKMVARFVPTIELDEILMF